MHMNPPVPIEYLNDDAMQDDEYFMKMALDLASKGQGETSPNPMVGAVIVKDGNVVGKGYHPAVGKAHAEVYAIDDAGIHAENATLYVTLEPCNHHGRTPPCTEKILKAGIRRLVVAMEDPNPDVKGGGMAYLAAKGISVTRGVLRSDAQKQNEAFIKFVKKKQPFVILKCAATLDGQIATRTGDARWVTGEASRQYVHQLRHRVDAILVGMGTVRKDNPSLTTRLQNSVGRNPIRIILDTHLTISAKARVVQSTSEAETWVITGKQTHVKDAAAKRERLEQAGVRLMELPIRHDRLDLRHLMPLLGQNHITSLLIEGGGAVMASAVSAGIVDKIMFFYAPKLLGGNDGVPMCSGKGAELMKGARPVTGIRVRRFDDDIMITGYMGS
jgi:diaminohydroxyphosphoribosylaminopyrimidine deaminase / 5-amino-6-(5-phosphoribosylamino)uracil reductase